VAVEHLLSARWKTTVTANATSKPPTFNADLANLPAALITLTRQPRWVVWRWE
jgi:hypothetical protein